MGRPAAITHVEVPVIADQSVACLLFSYLSSVITLTFIIIVVTSRFLEIVAINFTITGEC